MRLKRNPYRIITASLLIVTLFTGMILCRTEIGVKATGVASDAKNSQASVTVAESCSMSATGTDSHVASIPNGIYSGNYSDGTNNYTNGIGETTVSVFCNDPSGFSIYAIGNTGNVEGTTTLHSNTLGSSYDIATGTAQNGNTSNWAMKLGAVAYTIPGTSKSLAPTILSDVHGSQTTFSNWHAVPDQYEEVAEFGSTTDAQGGHGAQFTTTYAAYVSPTQAAGTYVGQVKYVLVHPNNSNAPDITSMQNVAVWGGAVPVGEEVETFDSRDGEYYTVGRICTAYSGDNCTASELWMTQNLNFAVGSTDGLSTLTSNDTDLNSITDENGNEFEDYTASNGVITWAIPSTSTLRTVAGLNRIATGVSNSSGNTDMVNSWTNHTDLPHRAEAGDIVVYSSGDSSTDTVYGTVSGGGLSACKTDRMTNKGDTEAEAVTNCKHYQVGDYYYFGK